MFPQRREAFDCFTVSAQFEAPGSVLSSHQHERAYVLMVFDGVVFDDTAQGAQAIGPGELLVRPAGFTHGNHFGDCVAPLYGHRWASARLTFPMVRNLPEQIRNEMAAHDAASKRILPGLVEQLLGVGARVASRSGADWLRQAVEMIDHSFTEEIRIADVARRVGVSPSRLCHGFREHFGCSIGDHIRSLRVEAAARALRESDESIAAIAASFGFADQAHFSRTFRGQHGMTPTEYRRTHRIER